uniref:Estradiol 17-beta-dehydrogenase 2 n=1 Tax=Anisakis simplex TaxID=6269 RepID=A0A0M3J3L3_ANISI
LKSEGDETKGSMRTVRLDVTSQESVQKAVVFTEMHLSGGLQLWALVNNAGFFALNGPDDWCSLEDYDQSLKVNTLGHIRVVHAFRHLLERSKGRIVTVTSATTRLPLAGACAYTVAQSAIEAYTNALRHEVRPFGITCHIIELGVFRTDFIDSASLKARLNTSWEKLTHKKKAKYGEEFKDDYIASVDADIQKRASSCLNCAVNTYYHSITARNPRLRYRCGFDAHFANFISYLPSPLAAILNAKNAKTPGKPSVLATTSNEKNSDKKEQ